MTVRDYLSKHARTARKSGLATAAYRATTEAATKALGTLDGPLRRSIWGSEWDVCLVLDACRLDLFREVAPEYQWLPTAVPGAWSVGSASPDWISATFGPEYRDHWTSAGYVTGNPFTGKPGNEIAALDERVAPLHENGLGYLDEPWRDTWAADRDLATVTPETMTERGLWAWGRRRELGIDRLVVHYMQPHLPFRSRPEWFRGWGGTSKFGEPDKQDDRDGWLKVRDGEIDAHAFWRAYRDNLRWVLDDIERWILATDAKILITADHGNGMGEWGVWSHPPRTSAPCVRRVPWVLVDGRGEDTAITYDPQTNPPVTGGTDETAVTDRLEALGYKS